MEKSVLKVEGMACEHCAAAVTKAVSALAGVSDVAVDLAGGTVTVAFDAGAVGLDAIGGAIEAQGYDWIR